MSLAEKIISDIAEDKLKLNLIESEFEEDNLSTQHVSDIKVALMEAFDAGYKMCEQSRG